MGCDIHMFVERRIDGRWVEAADYIEECNLRCYDTFAILAGVRNGVHGTFVPIAPPRGLPDDASETVKAELAEWGCDAHSVSHHTLRQLLEYDWRQGCPKFGVISWAQFERFVASGVPPEVYCADYGGPNVRVVSHADGLAILADPHAERPSDVRAEWVASAASAAGYFHDVVIPWLKTLGAEDDVRIVFWFDN
jgi:hypothetical protein